MPTTSLTSMGLGKIDYSIDYSAPLLQPLSHQTPTNSIQCFGANPIIINMNNHHINAISSNNTQVRLQQQQQQPQQHHTVSRHPSGGNNSNSNNISDNFLLNAVAASSSGSIEDSNSISFKSKHSNCNNNNNNASNWGNKPQPFWSTSSPTSNNFHSQSPLRTQLTNNNNNNNNNSSNSSTSSSSVSNKESLIWTSNQSSPNNNLRDNSFHFHVKNSSPTFSSASSTGSTASAAQLWGDFNSSSSSTSSTSSGSKLSKSTVITNSCDSGLGQISPPPPQSNNVATSGPSTSTSTSNNKLESLNGYYRNDICSIWDIPPTTTVTATTTPNSGELLQLQKTTIFNDLWTTKGASPKVGCIANDGGADDVVNQRVIGDSIWAAPQGLGSNLKKISSSTKPASSTCMQLFSDDFLNNYLNIK